MPAAASDVSTEAAVAGDTNVTVTSTIGKRHASASTNILDDESLKRTVDLAERLAKLSPEDPESMPELGPQTYTPVTSYFEKTADLTPEIRAVAAKKSSGDAPDTLEVVDVAQLLARSVRSAAPAVADGDGGTDGAGAAGS